MLLHWSLVVGKISTNCYIIADSETKEAAVIDPGAGADKILNILRQEKLTLKYIIITHGHFDHILALSELKKATNACVVIHEADADCLTDRMKSGAGMFHTSHEYTEADLELKGGEELHLGTIAIKAIHTPGHTKGGCCFMVQDHLYTGDTLFEDDCGRCDLPGGDYGVMLQSLRLLAALEGDYKLYPGHDVSTTLERERKHNVNMLEALRSVT